MRNLTISAVAALLSGTASAEVVKVDAASPRPAVQEDAIKQGTAVSPDGTRIGINNRYLTMNGKPWLPVMGELHYVRVPHQDWDAELAKVKASGVDIVASYVFWNYHEATPGHFDWSGDRDIHTFIKLAAKHDLKVVLRIGPWAHGEVRYGGTPDWIVNQTPLRVSDPTYMAAVKRFWTSLRQQTIGTLWKDGGPVIGIQLENEYGPQGPLGSKRHIMDLKNLALELGFDVPLYTLTAWPLGPWPVGEVALVSGGYADLPWGSGPEMLQPMDLYNFRFSERDGGNLGAQLKETIDAGQAEAQKGRDNVPYFGAEFGGGLPTMYRRRPVVTPDDVTAMLPAAVGSGNNLYGYYMYHGGRNLTGPTTTMEESTFIGGWNDVPIVEYDFQAPYGQYGEAAPVAHYLRPFHYFLKSNGEALAAMDVRPPAVTVKDDDLKGLRWSVRNNGDAGFVFVNNHVRNYPTAAHPNTQFSVALPGGRNVTFPSEGITVAPNAYFIWPFGMDLGGQTLQWASAQPVTRIQTAQGILHVFSAEPGVVPEFAFAAGTKVRGAQASLKDGMVLARVARPGTQQILTVERAGAPAIRIMVLTQAQSRKLWVSNLGDSQHLILTDDEVVDSGRTELEFASTGDANFAFAAYPALPKGMKGSLATKTAGQNGAFVRYSATAPARKLEVSFRLIREPAKAGAERKGGPQGGAAQPWPEYFGDWAGAWEISVPSGTLDGVEDAFLTIDWTGDIGRLFGGDTLLDDQYFMGRKWRVGLKHFAQYLDKPLVVRATPWLGNSQVYIEPALRPKIAADAQLAEIRNVTIEPRYKLTITTR